MGIYNFQERFVRPILSGRKTHTIRAERVYPDKPGNTLHLYTGLRHKGAKLLMRVPCTRIEEILITKTPLPRVVVDGHMLDQDEEHLLAYRDGFANFDQMLSFWKGRLPFTGHIIHWRKVASEQKP